jgi:hypothetical protein
MHEAANLRATGNQRPAKRARVSSAEKLAPQEQAQQQVCNTELQLHETGPQDIIQH